ncbi:MAG: hypothetical protein A2X59_10995 [Nitrospirae bacterium GWC2_42_7]|nr:MAG: hypothetical protein A2X59_10995 [Nitrospirae bacterium GWC2_42_7]
MKNQVIFITGSSSGIGRETAYRFASAGAKIVLTYYKGEKRGVMAEKHCIKLGASDTLLLHLDVTDSGSIVSALKKAVRKFGGIDVLVNNAGTGRFDLFKKQTSRDIERQIRTNLEGLIKMTHAAIPFVRKSVINIASAAGKESYPEMVVYCASKFGVRGFTQGLAQEYPRLRICSINPDMTSTRLSGYEGRPSADVADVIFRAASGRIKFEHGGDVDVWKILD